MPDQERPFIDALEVANMLGLEDRAQFLVRRARLERDEDFPLPMPQSRRPLLWRRDEIAAWLADHGLRPSAMADHTPPPRLRVVGGTALIQEAATP